MSLEDDLKARALSLISQQMANWVVEIQRQIQDHQGNFVKTLDELQESVARYDEKINEAEIAAAMAEVVAAQPPPPPPPPPVFAGPGSTSCAFRSRRSRRARASPRCSPTS